MTIFFVTITLGTVNCFWYTLDPKERDTEQKKLSKIMKLERHFRIVIFLEFKTGLLRFNNINGVLVRLNEISMIIILTKKSIFF
jgi:hypothetical protein